MGIKEAVRGKKVEIPGEVKNVLEPGEEVFHAYEQASITGKIGGAQSIYVTNLRIFKLVPTTLGLRRNIEDYRYEDMANVSMKRGITRSDISIKMRFLSNNVAIAKIPKDAAQEILMTIQKGIAGHHKTEAPSITKTDTLQSDATEQIRKLAELKKDGILSEVEFETKKKELLEKL